MNAIDNPKVTPLDRVELSKTFLLKDPYLYATTEFLNYLIELLDYESLYYNIINKLLNYESLYYYIIIELLEYELLYYESLYCYIII